MGGPNLRDDMLAVLGGESFLQFVDCCSWASACAVRAAAVSTCRSVDASAQLLLVSRLLLTSAPAGFSPPLALATCWRARPDASIADLTVVALLAAERGFLEYLRALAARMEKGAVLELSDAFGMTPLHVAASAGRADVCSLLCRVASEAHDPPGWQGVVAALSRRTAKKRTVLHCAAAGGDCATLEALLDGVPSDAMQDLLSAPDRRQRPCALIALHEGLPAAALRLVQFHSFATPVVDAAPATGSTAILQDAGAALLVHASEADDASLARLLLRRGADPNAARSSDKVTPLGAAAANGSVRVLQHLLDHGRLIVDLVEEGGGRTALHLACSLGQAAVAELLLASGANARLEAPGGRTPLYLAAERGSLECVEVLLRAGVSAEDAVHMTARSLTPISVAQRRGNLSVADHLLGIVAAAGPGLTWPLHCNVTAKMDEGSGARTPRTPRTPHAARHPLTLAALEARELSARHPLSNPAALAARRRSPSPATQVARQPSPHPGSARRPVSRAASREPLPPSAPPPLASAPPPPVSAPGTPRRSSPPPVPAPLASAPLPPVSAPRTPRHTSPPPVPVLGLRLSTSQDIVPILGLRPRSSRETVPVLDLVPATPRSSPQRSRWRSPPAALRRHQHEASPEVRNAALRQTPRQFVTIAAPVQQTPRQASASRCGRRQTPERPRPPRMPGAMGGA